MDELHQAVLAERGAADLQPLPADFYDQARRSISRAVAEVEMAATPLEGEFYDATIRQAQRDLDALAVLRIKKIVRGALAAAFSSEPKEMANRVPQEDALHSKVRNAAAEARRAMVGQQDGR